MQGLGFRVWDLVSFFWHLGSGLPVIPATETAVYLKLGVWGHIGMHMSCSLNS